jgi:hypothetical protein
VKNLVAWILAPCLSACCFTFATAQDEQAVDDGGDDDNDNDKIELRAEVKCVDWRYYYEETKWCAPMIVNIIATGEPAALASQYRRLKIEAFEDERGETHEPFDGIPFDKDWRDVERHVGRTDAERGVLISLFVPTPDPPIERIRRLAGSFQIFTGDPRSLIVERVKFLKNSPVDDAALKEFGLSVVVNPPESGAGAWINGVKLPVDIEVSVTGPRVKLNCLYSVVVTDADGHVLATLSGGHSGALYDESRNDSRYLYQYRFRDPLPDDALLYVVYLENAREVTVPFEFTDLEVPPPPPRDPELDALSRKEYFRRTFGLSETPGSGDRKTFEKQDGDSTSRSASSRSASSRSDARPRQGFFRRFRIRR